VLYSQYLRIQTKAGGIGASNRQIIKAVHSMLKPSALTHNSRENRHKIIKMALHHHNKQLNAGF
jgi:hypothetical protein